MGKLESDFQDGMLRILNLYGCVARNIHGNMFQSGIPDITVTSKYGVTFFCELKMWRRVYAPKNVESLFALLRKSQKQFVRNVWKSGGYCPIVASTADGRNVFYTHGAGVTFTYPDHLCKYFAGLQYKDFV